MNQRVIPGNNRVTERISILLPLLDLNSTYVRAAIYNYSSGKLIDTTNFFFVRPIYWNLPRPDLIIVCDDGKNSCSFSTTNFASHVYLELRNSGDTTMRLSNNFFDLTPGMPPIEVKILSNHTLEKISEILQVSSLYDSYTE